MVGRPAETTVESQLSTTVNRGISERGRMVVIGSAGATTMAAGVVRVVNRWSQPGQADAAGPPDVGTMKQPVLQ